MQKNVIAKTEIVFYYYACGDSSVLDMCDEVLTIVKDDSNVYCYYHGNSDEFESCREDYLPGFIALKATNLDMKDGKVSFELSSKKQFFVNKPVPPVQLVEKMDNLGGTYKTWIQDQDCYKINIKFIGTYDSDCIKLFNKSLEETDSKVFYRKDLSVVEKSYTVSLMSDEEIEENGIDTLILNK